MTDNQIVVFLSIWFFIAMWICAKRNWYDRSWNHDNVLPIIANIIFLPLSIIIVIVKEFIVREWEDK